MAMREASRPTVPIPGEADLAGLKRQLDWSVSDHMVELSVVRAAFRSALDLPDDFELTDESSFEAVPGWDSVGHMRIVLELENIIGKPLELDEIVGLDTVGKIRALLTAKMA